VLIRSVSFSSSRLRLVVYTPRGYVGQAVVDTAYFVPAFSNSDGLDLRNVSTVFDIGPGIIDMAWTLQTGIKCCPEGT
jgi:hypothetical protein